MSMGDGLSKRKGRSADVCGGAIVKTFQRQGSRPDAAVVGPRGPLVGEGDAGTLSRIPTQSMAPPTRRTTSPGRFDMAGLTRLPRHQHATATAESTAFRINLLPAYAGSSRPRTGRTTGCAFNCCRIALAPG